MPNVPNRTGVPEKTSQSEQYVLNYSFDELYKILMVGLAGFNPTTTNYDRIQIDNVTGGIKTSATNGGLVTAAYDYTAYTNTNTTTDTYVYKSGGAAGTTVATVTIVYTDTTKAQVSTVTRT